MVVPASPSACVTSPTFSVGVGGGPAVSPTVQFNGRPVTLAPARVAVCVPVLTTLAGYDVVTPPLTLKTLYAASFPMTSAFRYSNLRSAVAAGPLEMFQ